jgi:hypothetical protein
VLAFIEKNKLHISWLGDSQVVLVKNGRSIEVMNPHKPEREVRNVSCIGWIRCCREWTIKTVLNPHKSEREVRYVSCIRWIRCYREWTVKTVLNPHKLEREVRNVSCIR